jgi:tetratricopeptide (TPR) repeat protein
MDSATFDRYIQLLRSPNAEQRRQAIVALGRSKSPAALRPLAEVYRSETDDELRQLALRAGQFIKSQPAPQPPPAPVEPVAPATPALTDNMPHVSPFTVVDLDALDAAPVSAEPVPEQRAVQNYRLTKRGHEDTKQAKAYAEEALSLSLRGDNDKAIKAIKKAYSIAPELFDDTYFSGLATTVLHCGEDELLEYLKDDTRVKTAAKTLAQEKAEQAAKTHLDEAKKMSWLSVELDLMLFGLIMAIAPVLLFIILGQSIESWSVILQEEGGKLEQTYADILAINKVLDLRALVVIAGTFLVSGMLSVVVQCVAIHYSATRFLGGTGTLQYLMYKLISYYNRLLLILFSVLLVTTWLFIGNGFIILMIPVLIGLGLFGLLKFIKLGDRIGEAYKFTSGGGCMSVIVAGVVLVVSNGLIAYVAYTVLANVILTLLPTLGT